MLQLMRSAMSCGDARWRVCKEERVLEGWPFARRVARDSILRFLWDFFWDNVACTV